MLRTMSALSNHFVKHTCPCGSLILIFHSKSVRVLHLQLPCIGFCVCEWMLFFCPINRISSSTERITYHCNENPLVKQQQQQKRTNADPSAEIVWLNKNSIELKRPFWFILESLFLLLLHESFNKCWLILAPRGLGGESAFKLLFTFLFLKF